MVWRTARHQDGSFNPSTLDQGKYSTPFYKVHERTVVSTYEVTVQCVFTVTVRLQYDSVSSMWLCVWGVTVMGVILDKGSKTHRLPSRLSGLFILTATHTAPLSSPHFLFDPLLCLFLSWRRRHNSFFPLYYTFISYRLCFVLSHFSNPSAFYTPLISTLFILLMVLFLQMMSRVWMWMIPTRRVQWRVCLLLLLHS